MTDALKATSDAEKEKEKNKKKEPKYQTKLFQLRDIPDVMRSKLGWPVAAKLMDRWFSGAPYQISPSVKRSLGADRLSSLTHAQLDETTVSMRWALGFVRVRTALEQLQVKWASLAGLEMLKRRVNNQRKTATNQCWRFGNLGLPAKILEDTCQVNFIVFGKPSDPMDDFYGAMGKTQMNIAVSGMVTSHGAEKTTIEVDELGFYLRDTYDFNDDILISQFLGCWGFNGVECGMSAKIRISIEDEVVDQEPAIVGNQKHIVTNSDFRNWRARHQHGGDFMILSSVYRMRLPFPLKFSW